MRCVATVVAICLAVCAHAWAEDWGVKRDPFDAGVVRRYKALLDRDPHDVAALRELVALYKRYRTVAKLEAEYQAELGGSEDWATLVVLARLPRASRTETIALWNRALKSKPDDAQSWLAVGELATEATAARDAFQRAANHAASPRVKRLAFSKLVTAAKTAGDSATLDAAYAELIALAPKDGTLWLERGNAQLDAKRYAQAMTSFATAESLFATDPERRLTAMMNQGIALERLGRIDDAIAQYQRTLDKVPRGYYLGSELVPRIIDAERRRGGLTAAIALFEKRWPERARGHYEWATLGDLYKEAGDEPRALTAYQRAVAKAPTEVVTQRKLIQLLDKLRPTEALAQHEAAARVAPGDVDLQLELAKRYRPVNPPKALATLARLSRRMSKHVNVRRTIAELYTQWEEPALAIKEYEAIVRLEPTDPDHAIVLGEAYWNAGNETQARAAWDRLAQIGTAQALLRQGEVLTLHQLWEDAALAYTKSLALDGTSVDALRGRAQAYDELQRFADAAADAQRAVALMARATRDDGHRERHLLVRVLGRWYAAEAGPQLTTALARWRFAFERGDIGAGYLLAAHHGRLGSHQHHDVLLELYRRVPTDDSLGIELARSYRRRKDFGSARKELERIARRSPARAEEIGKQLAHLDEERERAEQEARWEEEGIAERERAAHRKAGTGPDLVGRHRRLGMRLGLGTDVRSAGGALMAIGAYRMHGISHGTAVATRFEWTQRDDRMESVSMIAVCVGITKRLLGARKFELAAGLGPRLELRYGSDAKSSAWDRVAITGDVMIEVLPRALPASLGVRFNQELTDTPRSSAVVLELGFEVR